MTIRTTVHVLAGAAVTAGLVFTGVSALLGGAVTSYLEGESIYRGVAAGVGACLLGLLVVTLPTGLGQYGTSSELQVLLVLHGGVGLVGSVLGAGLRRIRLKTTATTA